MDSIASKEDFLRAEQEFYKELYKINESIRRYKLSLTEHHRALELLNDLPKKTQHSVMVPLGPLAFMRGQLIHTNEVTLLLGDSYFVERSASQAVGIITRRKDFISRLITKSEEESKKLSASSHTTENARKNLLQNISEENSLHSTLREEPSSNSEEEDEDDDDGKGYEFWSSAGFVGAWSDNSDINTEVCAETSTSHGVGQSEPVFEILEPLDGGPGRIIRHSTQDSFEGLGHGAEQGTLR